MLKMLHILVDYSSSFYNSFTVLEVLKVLTQKTVGTVRSSWLAAAVDRIAT